MRLGISAYAPPCPAPRMPPGLVELMEGLSREVLRHNPPDLHQFCADHMHRLLLLRAKREGRTRAMTLEEKVARAQKVVRQRAEKRRKRYDEPDRQSPVYSDEEEIVDSDAKITPLLGLSPRVMPVARETDESNKDVAQEENKSSDCSVETEEAAGDTALDILTPKEIQEIVIDNAAAATTVNETEDSVLVQHAIETQKNVEALVEENDKKIEENAPTMEITKKSAANESQVINPENPIIDKLMATHQAVMQECDELPIENHIFERGGNKNEGANEAVAKNLSDDAMEIIEKTVEIVDVMESGVVAPDHEISSEKEKVAFIAELEIPKEEKSSVEIRNEIPAIINMQAAAYNENISYNTITETNQEHLPTKTANVDEIKTEVDLKEIKREDNTTSETDDPENKKSNYSVEIQLDGKEYISEKQLQMEVEDEIKSKHEQDHVMEKSSIKDNQDTKEPCYDTRTELNDTIENNSGVQFLAVEEKEAQKNSQFETVTIKVKSSTPSPELELRHELSDQKYVDKKNYIVDSNMKIPTETETLLTEMEKSQKNNKTSKLELKEQDKVEVNGENKVTENDIEIIELEIEPKILDENALIENEIIIMKSSSNEEETDSGSDNIAKEINLVETKTALLDTERMSYMSAPGHDIDINALAKSDSTNDMTIDDTTESNSETNTEVDESSNNAATMDLETAAVTIQKVFRTFLFKSRTSTLDDVTNGEGSIDVGMPEDMLLDQGELAKQEDELANIKERRALGITRMDTVLQTVNEEKSLSLSTDDSSTLSSAATTIQAHVRGFLVRNRLHSNKTASTSSLVNSDGLSSSLDVDNEQQKSKTVLNIHIVPEGHFMSRDESMAMSLDLPLDSSPPTSLSTLHPLSYDVSEKRKLLKREDAIQSISPPSNNSGKQSEDSGKETSITESDVASTQRTTDEDLKTDVSSQMEIIDLTSGDTSPTKSVTVESVLEKEQKTAETRPSSPDHVGNKASSANQSADEMDVVTPFVLEKGKVETPRLLHSGECHDVVLPTCVSRSETTVVREFKNVLGYFLLWNNAS